MYRKQIVRKQDNNLIYAVNQNDSTDQHYFTSINRAQDCLGFDNGGYYLKKIPLCLTKLRAGVYSFTSIKTLKGVYNFTIVDGSKIPYGKINW